jgi:HPt (histidine-containing phosphotransfer) domain-containing protein
MDYRFINTGYIVSVSGGDKEIISELVTMFNDQVLETVSEMNLLLEKKDYLNLGLLAHKAKSSVAIMGMEELAILLKTFELEAKAGTEPSKYKGYIDKFEHDTTIAVTELNDFVTTL